ncbi:type II toxin-antitoxin system RelE/ParE family toxin [Candidatus Pacearchaeota archaeon]|nr:type II toxin-antitoxin system RelE/ParE family toxin [Candidatus Pacearchaeota archaeon]
MKITRSPLFLKQIKNLDSFILKKLKKQIFKIIKNPEIGKPLKYRRGERSIYIKPFRLVYSFSNDVIYLLKFGHRKDVYK